MKFPIPNSQFPIPGVPPAPLSSFVFRPSSFPRAFSLVEVLLAIFILGIGMIMVASVFPVGATWTRQTTEDSVAQTIAQNALSVLQRHYGDGGDLRGVLTPDFINVSPGPIITPNILSNFNTILKAGITAAGFPPLVPTMPPPPFVLQAPPGFYQIPPSERAYQFGSANPFPAANPSVCTYFWTALMRLNPAHAGGTVDTNGIMPTSTYKYDVYILVFRKGSADQVFTSQIGEIIAARDFNADGTINPPPSLEPLIPAVGYATWNPGVYDPSRSPSIVSAIPPIGQYGIGAFSGTVFRQVIDPATFTTAAPRPMIIPAEPVIYSPPADGTAASPLIYIYQTTMSF